MGHENVQERVSLKSGLNFEKSFYNQSKNKQKIEEINQVYTNIKSKEYFPQNLLPARVI